MATAPPSVALTKRSFDASLMPPPPSPKRIKRPAKVLDEDEYTDALSHIIARDFFPGLLETESQQEYIDALESKDSAWIAAAGKRLRETTTPRPGGRILRGRRGTNFATPTGSTVKTTPRAWSGETPNVVTTASNDFQTPEQSSVNVNMSLGAFQEKYTSEDNESFYKLLDKQNTKRSEKYAWMWAGNKIPAARQIAHRHRERLLADQRSNEAAANGKELVKAEPVDSRQAMPDTWISQPRNAFMFAPDSVEDYAQTVAQKKEGTSMAPPRAISHDNTRVQRDSLSQQHTRPSSPTLSAAKDAIAGRPRPTQSEASFTGASTPTVNGYSFVDSEETDSHYEPPVLSSDEKTSNPFKLGEGSKREALHHRMVDNISKSKRLLPNKREQNLKYTDTPKFMSSPRIEKKGGLTPAAERLLGKVGGARITGTPSGLWDAKSKTPRMSSLRNMVTPKTQKR